MKLLRLFLILVCVLGVSAVLGFRQKSYAQASDKEEQTPPGISKMEKIPGKGLHKGWKQGKHEGWNKAPQATGDVIRDKKDTARDKRDIRQDKRGIARDTTEINKHRADIRKDTQGIKADRREDVKDLHHDRRDLRKDRREPNRGQPERKMNSGGYGRGKR